MRRTIWKNKRYVSSIIGVCLNVGELRSIARKKGQAPGSGTSDFGVLAGFARLCCEPGGSARAVNQFLDRKYAGDLARFATSSNDVGLARLWEESVRLGRVPGPYWALMSHPSASPGLRRRICREAQLLARLAGAADRAGSGRIAELEDALGREREKRAEAGKAYRSRLKGLTRENRALGRRLGELAKEAEALRFRAKKYGNEVLYRENRSLQNSLAVQAAFLCDEQVKGVALERRLEAHEVRVANLERELREKQAEVAFLEEELERFLGSPEPASPGGRPEGCPEDCDRAGTDRCPGPDLCGKRILYVGGRAELLRHYRHVVERRGGEFVHHGGGIEKVRHALPEMLRGVDAVVCPVDCVSHDDCQWVRDVCKHTMRPYKLLPSSALSSLVRSLEELMGQPQQKRRN